MNKTNNISAKYLCFNEQSGNGDKVGDILFDNRLKVGTWSRVFHTVRFI